MCIRDRYKIVDSVQVIGGTNVQFAHDPVTDRIIVIEINPRTSRSSALASKATGFPIALVSAMLAAGLTLKDIPCGKYGTLDKYVPDGDYVVIKFARWAFEKFKGVEDKLGTQMRAVGEVMSIGTVSYTHLMGQHRRKKLSPKGDYIIFPGIYLIIAGKCRYSLFRILH